MKMENEEIAGRLLETIKKSTCAFTAVEYSRERLINEGFEELKMDMEWEVQPEGRYFINLYDSALLVFSVGKKEGRLKITAAHTDHPCFSVKPNADMISSGYGRVNVEVYGGPILNTWMDRPLSIAGKVVLRGDEIFQPHKCIVDFKRPVAVMPNLAIHLNHQVNKGIELNRQTDTQPLCTMLEENFNEKDFFQKALSNEMQVKPEDILDYELYVYNQEEGCVLGLKEEFLSAPRLDNITSVEACIQGMMNIHPRSGIQMAILYDHEEIGSRTKQGADSMLISILLEKIFISLGKSREEYLKAVMNGFFVSLDVAHALHPNRPEKSDPTNKNLLNKGIILKRAAAQTYATDSTSIGIVEQICRQANIPYQKYAVRSDGTTGSTLGCYAGKYLPMRMVDVGVPVLAMHSARETMGVDDQKYLEMFVREFFRCE